MFHLEDLAGLARTIDPERAESLVQELGDAPALIPAILLATAFPPFTPRQDWQLEGLSRLAHAGFRRPRNLREFEVVLESALESGASPEERIARFRRAVWLEKARIALRELLPTSLGGAHVETTSLELSQLADAVLGLALREAEAETEERYGPPLRADGERAELVVLGMGKLGGNELNAGSDVDLIFIYDTDEGESRVSLHEHFTRVTRRLVQLIDTPSADGLIWRVDLRLRPEGSQGPLVNSVAAAERYYETWGRLWERSALLRSRRSAGSVKLGQLLEREVITPFVFRHEVDPQIAAGLADLVHRSRRELSPSLERDLKLGPGGIREAEFFVQSLQLIWGGQQPLVRKKNTLEALARLRNRGLVSDREARSTASAYVLLRKVEHRIQWMTGLQTHLLPEEGPELERLARSLRFPKAEVLLSELERARADVHRVFQALAPHSSPVSRPSRYAALVAALDSGRDALLAASEGVYPNADVVEHLLALARRPDDLLGAVTRERYPSLAERVLEAVATSSDAEQAAQYLRSFFARFLSPAPYVAALAEDPIALRRLVTVLGASVFVGEALTARPDFADVVLFGEDVVTSPSEAVESEIQAQLAALPDDAEPYERQEALVTGLRIAKRRLMVEVAAADLEGTLGMREVMLLLSLLADEELQRAAEFELGPGSSGLAVIALGKLGGRELGYGSDLDVLFIYDPQKAPNPEEAGAYFARKAQRIIHLISEPNAAGPGYDLDTRLRPSGSQGMLVTSLESFARYHAVRLEGAAELGPGVQWSGAAWERQTLLRARYCAGDRALGERAIQIAERAAYDAGAPPAGELRRLRARMEKELGRERSDRYDLKTGRGGLLDVEFAVQWLQMVHGKDPAVRTTDTTEAIEALYRRGYLARAEYETFREGYRFLRRLEQRIHVLRGAGSSALELRSRGLQHLARRMGYRDGPGERALDQLLERYRDVTTEVREAFDRILT